jgi:hypothetical protein
MGPVVIASSVSIWEPLAEVARNISFSVAILASSLRKRRFSAL